MSAMEKSKGRTVEKSKGDGEWGPVTILNRVDMVGRPLKEVST